MKNLIKVLGIIAMFAVIGLGSCEVDEEEQTSITVTGIPAAFNGKYAYVGVSDSIDGKNIREVSLPKQIANGTVSQLPLLNVKDNKAATAKNGYIVLGIDSQEDLKGTTLYGGVTRGVKILGEGNKSVDATEDFSPSIGDAAKKYIDDNKTPEQKAKEKVATFLGKYSVTYKESAEATAKTIIEKVDLSTDIKFYIEDDSAGTGADKDYLDFTITKWNESTTPDDYKAAYPNAFKFEGKIVTQKGFCGNDSQTGKGITKDEAPGLECTMYLYFASDGKFVRTPFTKKSATTENTGIVVNYTSGTGANAPRVYTKQ